MEEKEQPILSILIPTYNGASKYIVDVLDFVVKGISLCDSGEIEVVVSNNASTDDTEEFLKRFEKYPFFRHYLNRENIGFAKNIILLTDTYARGRYGWVIGDDDLIDPNFLPFVLNYLKQSELDYLSLGFRFIQEKSEASTNEYTFEDVTPSTFAGSLEHGEKGNLLGTFMSSAIFNSALFREVKKNAVTDSFDTFQSVFPNGYINATAFFDKNCGYITKPVVFPISHPKEWATSDNNYRIFTQVLPNFYDYIVSLGVNKKDLKNTFYILHSSALKYCIGLLIRGKKIDKFFFMTVKNCLFYPSIWFSLAKMGVKKLIKQNNKRISQ